YERICAVVFEVGGFDAGSVYLLGEDPNFAHRVAYAGPANEAQNRAETLDISPAAPWTLMRECVRSGQKVVVVDMSTDERLRGHWGNMAAASGLTGGCLLPLRCFDRIMGAVALYTDGDDLRDAEVLDLIDEIGRDVSHALDTLELRHQRQAAEA